MIWADFARNGLKKPSPNPPKPEKIDFGGPAGPFSILSRYHLGLEIPRSKLTYLTVLDQVDRHRATEDAVVNATKARLEWREGEDLLFDDTFFHGVVNAGGAVLRRSHLHERTC